MRIGLALVETGETDLLGGICGFNHLKRSLATKLVDCTLPPTNTASSRAQAGSDTLPFLLLL